MLNAKRRRSEPRAGPSPIELSSDCYQDVLGGSEGKPEPDPPVRSSWLRRVEWIQRYPCHECDGLPVVAADDGVVKTEITSLQMRLCQVKRRLGPAAERCTEAWNSCYNNVSTTGFREFVEARRACNPYEVLGEGKSGGLNNLFMNRSAIKLANMNAMLDFCLTCYDGEGPFLFVDLCGAPGGFSEYILRRCHAMHIPACRGYGISLTGRNEHGQGTPWKLQDAVYFESGTHCSYRVCQGTDGTGDVFHWDNIKDVHDHLREDCNELQPEQEHCPEKVHLVVADGGFDAQRDSEHQEELAQKLVVCEVAAGLALLRLAGTMTVKMFGFQTEVVRTVMHDLFFLFDSMIILKPISSRPASAERYVVCSGFKGLPTRWDGPRWRNRMFLGKSMALGPTTPGRCENTSQRLNRYLDRFDCDLLTLNLKACFAILSYLENKCMVVGRADYTEHTYFSAERALVNIESYKYTWRLVYER